MSKALIAGMAVLASLAIAGCKATGGGTFAGLNGKGNFGFVFDDSKQKLSGTYHDGGVRFSFTGTTDNDTSFNTCVDGDGTYRSTNPALRGGGDLHFEACDNDPSGSGTDTISVQILNGPHAGYSFSGDVTGGNVVFHGLNKTL